MICMVMHNLTMIMNKFKSLFVALLVSLPCCMMAQEDDTLKVRTHRIGQKPDSLSGSISERDSMEAIIKQMNVEVREKDKMISRLKKRLQFADSCFLRISNDCFCRKYDQSRVDRALENFDRMYSDNLKKQFAPLKELLARYGEYYTEIYSIFSEIEKEKGFENPFFVDKCVNKSVVKIKSSRYYHEAYDSNWTIAFLNDAIDKAFVRLKKKKNEKSKNPGTVA